MYGRLLGVLAALSLAALSGGCAQPGPVRILSLNTHAAPAAVDGDDWALRQTEVLDAIRSGKPAVSGLPLRMAPSTPVSRKAQSAPPTAAGAA